MVKITIPPGFGLTPKLTTYPVVNLRDDDAPATFRHEIEFVPSTPLEYLGRWIACNEVFEDDVQLSSVIEWTDGQISFSITQPQYHGVPASDRQIEQYFEAAGWTRLPDVSGHLLYYSYAFNVLAIDAVPRNCYVHDDALLPFDVILCHPEKELERFLGLFPE